MAVYDVVGDSITNVYDLSSNRLSQAYDIFGDELLEEEEPWVKTVLSYDTNWLIKDDWLSNAEYARNQILSLYTNPNDSIPFFIQTDGHGRYNEGNKGCHNLAEQTMGYITNIQLGDYESYYNNGANPQDHTRTSSGLVNYIPVIGNHEFMQNPNGDIIADMPSLIASYTPSNGILGSNEYGYYKIYDNKYNVKYLVGQPYIPDSNNSNKYITKYTADQYNWFINELSANDNYDIIVLNHEPYPGTYYIWSDGTTSTWSSSPFNLTPILSDRKAKRSGSYTDNNVITYTYDFSSCDSDLLCVFHGHMHKIMTMDKTYNGYPVFVGRDFTNAGDSAYGMIDRKNKKLHIYTFNKNAVDAEKILDL